MSQTKPPASEQRVCAYCRDPACGHPQFDELEPGMIGLEAEPSPAPPEQPATSDEEKIRRLEAMHEEEQPARGDVPIYDQRVAANVSLRELATRLGWPAKELGDMEHGRLPVTAEARQQIHEALALRVIRHEQPARGDGVRTFTHAEYIRDPSPATQAALDGYRVVVLDSAGKPSLTFCGQPGDDERAIEGVVVWEQNDPYPCVKVSDDPETGWVELDSLLRGLLNRRVRVAVTVLDDAPGKDGAK